MEKNSTIGRIKYAIGVVLLAVAFAMSFLRGGMGGNVSVDQGVVANQQSGGEETDQQGSGDSNAMQGGTVSQDVTTQDAQANGTGTGGGSPGGEVTQAQDTQLRFYPCQTNVGKKDVYIYGKPVGVPDSVRVHEDGSYTSMEDVALYIHTYGTVPRNFVSKTKARNAGWVAKEGNLQDVLPGMSIGGGGWSNYEQIMPGDEEDNWYECDINYEGGFRGAERLVYSDNGMIFYTPDHYNSYARIF